MKLQAMPAVLGAFFLVGGCESEQPIARQASALGSGFIIDEKGVVITNNHVIQGAEDIFVTVNGEKEYAAEIVGADPLSDIAVLKIKSGSEISTT